MRISLIPVVGIQGEQRLREAATGEFRAIIEMVRAAIVAVLYPNQTDRYVSLKAIYADRAVLEDAQGRLVAFPYTLSDTNQVVLGTPMEVIEIYMPVPGMREAAGVFVEAAGVFVEAQDEKGLKWLIRVIRSGLSGNRNYYPDATLREAVPLFQGARVFVKGDDEHLAGQGKNFRNLIGRLTSPNFVEGKSPDTGEIRATLELLEASGDVPAKMREAWSRGMANDLFGFSIDAAGTAKAEAGRRVAQKISKVHSVDLIIEPGAGGQLINLIEALHPDLEGDMSLRERMIEAIKKANGGKLPEGFDIKDDDKIETAYREAISKNQPPGNQDNAGAAAGRNAAAGPDRGGGQPAAVSRDDLEATVRMVEARAHLRAAVAESGLPDIAKAKIKKQFDGRDRFTEADVDTAIADERAYLGKFLESGKVSDLGGQITSGEDRSVKIATMLDAFFDPAHKDHRNVQSFKECYIEITGDRMVTGRLENIDRARLREAVGATFRESLDSTSFADLLGDSVTRRMQAIYTGMTDLQSWRKVATVGSTVDFRTQEAARMGGYGNLPIVGQGNNYAALASPGDDKSTWQVAKRGGTEDITLEMIKNDDRRIIIRIPLELALAAGNTLYEFVFDFFRTNPNAWDGVALYHASHNNLFTVALSATEFSAHRLAMQKQTRAGSGKRLATAPGVILVPFDLQETAYNLFVRNQNLDKTFVQTINPEVITVDYWTDTNDWVTVAPSDRFPVLEIDFLDGQEEPQLFVQDLPNVGSMFSNDKLTYKIRHIYGGNLLVDAEKGTTKAVVP